MDNGSRREENNRRIEMARGDPTSLRSIQKRNRVLPRIPTTQKTWLTSMAGLDPGLGPDKGGRGLR